MRHDFRRLNAVVARRGFLIRTLVTTFLAACVPLIIISQQFVNREAESMRISSMALLNDAARSVASQLGGYLDAMDSISLQMQLSGLLYENRVTASVADELDALKELGYYRPSLPFVKSYGLYFAGGIDSVYSADGKFRSEVYAEYILGISGERLREIASLAKSPGFVGWRELGGNMLYISEISNATLGQAKRVSVFAISETSLIESLRTLLAGRYGVAAIYKGGELIFASSADIDPCYMRARAKGERGLEVEAFAYPSAFDSVVASLTSHVELIAVGDTLLCLILIVIVVFVNYSPIRRMLNKISAGQRRGAPHKNELARILEAYSSLEDEKGRLALELYEKNIMLTDTAIDRLLSTGRAGPLPGGPFRFDRRAYYLVSARLSQVANAASIIEKNAPGGDIYAIEMYADDRLILIAGAEDANSMPIVRERAAALLGDAEFQISAPRGSIEALHEAYLETAVSAPDGRREGEAALLEYIAQNFADPMFCMNDVAEFLGVSVYAASRVLKGITGINFRRYLNDMRVERAKDLLLTTEFSVADIAEKAGFTSASYFIDIFKKAEDVTPSAFRHER